LNTRDATEVKTTHLFDGVQSANRICMENSVLHEREGLVPRLVDDDLQFTALFPGHCPAFLARERPGDLKAQWLCSPSPNQIKSSNQFFITILQ